MSKLHWGAFRDANEKEDKWVVSGYSLQFLLSMFLCHCKLECWCLSQHLWITKIDFIPCLIRVSVIRCSLGRTWNNSNAIMLPPKKKKGQITGVINRFFMCDQSLFNYLRKILDRGPIQKKTFLSCGSCEGTFSLCFSPFF